MIEDWTYESLCRLHRSLRRRLKGHQGIVSIAFGKARRQGVFDRSRPFAVCIYVRKKRQRLAASQRVPPSFTLRLKGDMLFDRYELPSDVVECRSCRSTGRLLFAGTSHLQMGTLGPLLRWKTQGAGKDSFRLAFLSVAHPLRHVPLQGLVEMADRYGERVSFGRLLARSSLGSGRDVALIEVTSQALKAMAPHYQASPGLWGIDELLKRLGRPGRIIRFGSTPLFQWGVFHPYFQDVEGLGPIKDLFEGISDDETGPFLPGTSGAAWMAEHRLACLQTASFVDHRFRVGLGQSILPLLEWTMLYLSKSPEYVPGSLQVESVY